MGAIDTTSIDSQLETLYLGYFGRAADGGGLAYWEGNYASDVQAGNSADTTLNMIANSFAQSSEAIAQYPFLANPGTVVGSQGSAILTLEITNLVTNAYTNLFARTPPGTDAGVKYWVNQLQTGAVTVPDAIIAIANGATGADVTTLNDKIAAATFFTTQTAAANQGLTQPLSPSYVAAAHTASSDVTTDPTTVTTSENDTTTFINGTAGATFTLTQNADNGAAFTTNVAGAVFNAFPFVTALGLGNNTLNIGDNLQDSANDGTLTFVTTPLDAANKAFATNVTLNGIKTLNITDNSGLSGFQGSVTGLQVVNDQGSVGTVKLGAIGQGLNTALTNVNILGFAGGNGATVFEDFQAPSAASAANKLTVTVNSAIGATGFLQADKFVFSNDVGGGTTAAPNTAYGTLDFTFAGTSNVTLSSGGGAGTVSGTTELDLRGAGNVGIGTDVAGSFQLLKTIDASTATGSVYITGAIAGVVGSNADVTAANPGGLFGSASGLLTADTSLTSFKGGAGTNTLDVSGFTTAAQLTALVADATASTMTNNKIILQSALVDSVTSAPLSGIKGFEVIGDVGATGVIDLKSLPTSVTTIEYQTASTGVVTINDQTVALAIDTEQNGVSNNLIVGAVGPAAGTADSLTVLVGNTGLDAAGTVGTITVTGDELFTLTSNVTDSATGPNKVGGILLTPSLTGNESATIGGTHDIVVGDITHGALADVNAGGALTANNMILKVTNSGTTTLVGTQGGGPLDLTPAGDTTELFFSTNAVKIDASASGGLIMQAGDANFTTSLTVAGSSGDTIIGSTTAGNVLGGSIGNDILTGTTSTTAASVDTIYTGNGADTITLATGHAGADHIGLYGGFNSGVQPGGIEVPRLSSIVDGTDHAQLGTWGIATGGVATTVATFATAAGFGTNADMSTVTGFVAGAAAAPQDVVDLGTNAWGVGLLHDTAGASVASGNAHFTNGVTSGGAVTLQGNVLVFATPILSASALVTTLAGAGAVSGVTFNTGSNHLVIAWQDLASNLHLSDLDVINTGAATNTTAGSATQHLALSDMVQLTGTNVAQLHEANVHFA